ncbi:MAG TPA: carbamoyltransferase [Candidatus Eisenbacteria bacterium]|nr:carbamoyltransferase [Candidatus Eisenbacteria bacterium]
MSVTVLGVSCFYHDAAAAVVRDGEIVAAAQEERFTRKKHDPRFPRHAINYCLEEAFIEPSELDAVVFYDNPVLSFDRVVKSLLSVAPNGREQWLQAAPSFLGVKLWIGRYLRDELKADVPVLCTRHHLSHAASAFYPSPFERAAVVTVDGVGEWATTSIACGEGERLETLKEIHYPHSLGLLYSAFTYFCGFKVNSGEYKLMGLAPYGVPRYADEIREKLIAVKPDGSFRLNLDYFGFLDSNVITNEKFHVLFGGSPRQPESRITRREMDLAASIQKVTEEVMLGLARHARDLTGCKDLCLAGGVALNCVANGLVLRERIFDRIWIQPAAGDAGGALGAALAASHLKLGVPRRLRADGHDTQKGSYLGPAYSKAEVRAFLDRHGYPYDVVADDDERARIVAHALSEGKVVGFLSGRMEFGPRALGARSILGDPRRPETQALMNLKIKYRESFRPFAPAVLEERCSEYFELDTESPYMLLVAPVVAGRRKPMDRSAFESGDDDLLPLVRQARSDIPAVTHLDYSARVQTVRREEHPDFYRVIEAFERATGCAVLVNTSFNVRGEPIVCTPEDAYRCFARTEMDLLVLEDCLLWKEKQPAMKDDGSWRTEYELD